MPAVKTGDLTTGELLLIDRRRRTESQPDAARRHGVSHYTYRAWEEDREVQEPSPGRSPVGRLRPHERYFLMRRRAGLSLRDCARAMKVTPWWLTQMEYGRANVDRLREFWEARRRKAG